MFDDVGHNGSGGDRGGADGDLPVAVEKEDAVEGDRLPGLDAETFHFEGVAGRDAVLFAAGFEDCVCHSKVPLFLGTRILWEKLRTATEK